MSSEDEQHKLYTDIAIENAHDILCKQFCNAVEFFEFSKLDIDDKKKILRELAEEII